MADTSPQNLASSKTAQKPRDLLVDGLRQHKAGRVRKALGLYRRAVILDPALADGWHMMGAAALQQGEAEAALVLLTRSCLLSPRDALLHANIAHAWRTLGCHAEASAALANAVSLDPGRAEFWQDLGLVMAERHLPRNAERCLAHAVHLQPDPSAYVRHANALLALGRCPQADQSLTVALSLAPDHLGARLARAGIRSTHGNLPGALHDAQQAVALFPDTPSASDALGGAHLQGGQLAEAIRWRGRAARLAPGDATAWLALGRAAIALGPGDAAATALKRAIAIDPALPEAYDALADVRQGQGDTREARHLMNQRLRLAPDPAAMIRQTLCLPVVPDSEAAIDSAREHMLTGLTALEQSTFTRRQPPGATAETTGGMEPVTALRTLPGALGHHDRDNRAVMERLTRVLRHVCPRLDHTAPLAPPPAADAPLRLVILLPPDLTVAHGLTSLVAGLLPDLRARPDLILHVLQPGSTAPRDDTNSMEPPIGPSAGPQAPVFLPEQLDQARAMIAALAPDALLAVDPMAASLTWALVFGRLAPVQAMVCGCPVTSGLPTLDYVLTSQSWDSAEAESNYTEQLIRLRTAPLALSPPPKAPSLMREDLGLRGDETTRLYLLTAGPDRLRPSQDNTWIDILHRDPQGRLLVPGPPHKAQITRLLARWHAHTPVAQVEDRIRFLPPMTRSHLLGLARIADCVLEAQSGGPTLLTLDAVSAGIPVVTLPIRIPGGRVLAGLYQDWRIPDLIARDVRHFVNLSLRIARHDEWRQDLGLRLVQATQDPTLGQAAAAEMACFFRAAREAAADGRRLTTWPMESNSLTRGPLEPWAFASAPETIPDQQ